MPIVASIQTLSTAAQIIAQAGPSMSDKVTVVVKNPSATIFLGGVNVTSATGMPLAATDAISLDLGPGDILYAIASAATPTVAVLATRQ